MAVTTCRRCNRDYSPTNPDDAGICPDCMAQAAREYRAHRPLRALRKKRGQA